MTTTRWDVASPSAVPHGRPAREHVITDVESIVRWHTHDFPHALARWHTHPEVEIHLITASSGSAFVGDYVGRFSPGHVVAVGSDLPHNWTSELSPGEVVRGRDVVLQIDPQRFRRMSDIAPEARDAATYFASIRRGIEYTGDTAHAAAGMLRSIGESRGLARLGHLFQLLGLLSAAPATERVILSREAAIGGSERASQDRVDTVLQYISSNLSTGPSLTHAARLVGMTPSSLSRFFRATTGRGFAETARRIRILRAGALLVASDATVLTISREVGYENLSNFNRQFLREMGQTPTAYRAALRGSGSSLHRG
ncbi:AraC family transcriptional regulator [Microbacterium sp. 4NA327F11]|uniref:AraC family transcriptional regulator n=2 Tax=Microbacteriaceae TaxID=85023 RepID=UPI00201695B5|nr:AraC family transcriptional regulator [Microbacterium sp. 4NA327F11]